MELSQEEFRGNICLRYGLMHQDIPTTCNGCGKKFSIEHAPACPNGGLIMARHNDAAKEGGALGSRALVPSAITYEHKSTVGQYRRRGLWQDHDRIIGLPMAAQIL